jgi:hypothetical protein
MTGSVVGLWGGIIVFEDGYIFPIEMDFGADGIVDFVYVGDMDITELRYSFDGLAVRIVDTTDSGVTWIAELAVMGDDMTGEVITTSLSVPGNSYTNSVTLQRR